MTMEGHSKYVKKLLLFKKGVLCSASNDGTIKFWDVKTGNIIHTLNDHKGFVLDIILLKNGMLASVGKDKTIRLWKGKE